MEIQRKLKIAAFPNANGFCFYYRLKYPLEELERRGLIELKIVQQEALTECLEATEWADIAIYQYASPHKSVIGSQEIVYKHKLPKLIVSEFDDDLYDISETNPCYVNMGTHNVDIKTADGQVVKLFEDGKDGFDIERNKKVLENMTKAIVSSDLVTVSSKALQQKYSHINEHCALLPNRLQPLEMVNANAIKKRAFKDEIVILWQGGDSHFEDMVTIMPVFVRLQKRYGKMLKFRFIGSNFKGMYANLNYEHIAWVKPNLYYDIFSRNLGDIGAIPLSDTPFNRCKSNIKWLEYSYYSIPSVVSNVTPYKEHITQGYNGFLYDNLDQAYDKFVKLIEDDIFRIKMASRAKKEVDSKWNIKDYALDWLNIYDLAYKEKLKSLGI